MTRRALVLDLHCNAIIDIVRRHRGKRVFLFGSTARGEDTETSDCDFLVEFETGSSLFDLLNIHDELEALLGVSVDVVSTGGLKPRDGQIRRDAIELLVTCADTATTDPRTS